MPKEYVPGEKKLKWIVEFEVDAVWVQDGFNMTDDRALDMLAHDLSYANVGEELDAKVIKAPSIDEILRIQGYRPEKMSKEEKRSCITLMKKKQHGGPRKGAGMKAEEAEGKLSQYRLSLDKPTVKSAEEIGDGNISLGVRIAVKAYPVKERK